MRLLPVIVLTAVALPLGSVRAEPSQGNAGPLPSFLDPLGGPDAKRQVWGRSQDARAERIARQLQLQDSLQAAQQTSAGSNQHQMDVLAAQMKKLGMSDSMVNNMRRVAEAATRTTAAALEPKLTAQVTGTALGWLPEAQLMQIERYLNVPMVKKMIAGIQSGLKRGATEAQAPHSAAPALDPKVETALMQVLQRVKEAWSQASTAFADAAANATEPDKR